MTRNYFNEIKQCQKCGSDAILIKSQRNPRLYRIVCVNQKTCGRATSWTTDVEDLVDRWNKRKEVLMNTSMLREALFNLNPDVDIVVSADTVSSIINSLMKEYQDNQGEAALFLASELRGVLNANDVVRKECSEIIIDANDHIRITHHVD